MVKTLQDAVKSKGAGEAVLYAGLIGLVLSDIIPTPADAVYFRMMSKNKKLLKDGKIPSSEIQRLQTNLAEYEKKVAEMRQNELQLQEHQKKMNNAVAVAPNITEGNGSTIKPKLPIPNQTTLSIAEPKYK